MAEFYVNKQAETEPSLGHLVHSTTCADLPAADTMLYLGSFASGNAAYNKAKGYYNEVNFCSTCLPE